MWKMAKETPLAQATWCLKKHPNGKCTGSFKKNRKQNRNDLFSRCFKLFDLFNQQNCFWMGCLSLVLFIGMTNPRQAFAYGPKTGAAFLRFFFGYEVEQDDTVPCTCTADRPYARSVCWVDNLRNLRNTTAGEHISGLPRKRPRKPEHWLRP